MVTDDIEDTRDRRVSEHVLRMHRYRQAGTEEGAPVRENATQSLNVALNSQADSQRPTDVYEKYDAMLHAGVTITSGRGANKRPEVLSIPFMKKYIQYAKTRIKPVLTQEAADRIDEIWTSLRNDDLIGNQRKTSPMTVRSLETLVRLSTAHAKSRLSNRVEARDVAAAEGILRFALFKEVLEDESRKKRRKTRTVDFASSDEGSSSEEEEDEEDRAGTHRGSGSASARPKRSQRAGNGRRNGANGTNVAAESPEETEEDGAGEEEEQIYDATPRRSNRSGRTNGPDSSTQGSFASSVRASQLPSQTQDDSQDDALASDAAGLSIEPITTERLGVFRTALGQLLNTNLFEDDSAPVDDVVSAVNVKVGSRQRFVKAEAVEALKKMQDANQIMYVLCPPAP